MSVACVAHNALYYAADRLDNSALDAIERLVAYGYDVVVEEDALGDIPHADDVSLMKRWSDNIGSSVTVAPRGYCKPSIVFDSRAAGWKGWRVAMVEVDERHRVMHDEWRRLTAKPADPPTVEPADEDDSPPDCIS